MFERCTPGCVLLLIHLGLRVFMGCVKEILTNQVTRRQHMQGVCMCVCVVVGVEGDGLTFLVKYMGCAALVSVCMPEECLLGCL